MILMRIFLLVFFLFCGAWAQSGNVPVKEDSSALVKKTEETVFLDDSGKEGKFDEDLKLNVYKIGSLDQCVE